MHSSFIINNAMDDYFLQFHEITSTPTKNTYPMVDLQLFASPTQLASQNPLKTMSLPPRHNLKSNVPFIYLVMHFTAIQCGEPTLDMNWLTVLTTNARSILVPTNAYMGGPATALYGIHSISLCIFLNSLSKNLDNLELTLDGLRSVCIRLC